MTVPVDQTSIKTLYVFVEIGIDSKHLEKTIRMNFPDDRNTFHRNLLGFEEDRARIPIGTKIGVGRNLLIENGDSSGDPDVISPNSKLPTRLSLVSTIQFVAALQRLKEDLSTDSTMTDIANMPGQAITTAENSKFWTGRYEATIPRSKPLSPGEILGCTAPRLADVDALMYVSVDPCPSEYPTLL
jgi:2-(3-amino-3-carboxypropyl)histidine synthase